MLRKQEKQDRGTRPLIPIRMRSREAVLRSLRSRRPRLNALVRSYEPLRSDICARCLSTTKPSQFDATRSTPFAFRWFRGANDDDDNRRTRWLTLVQRHRTRGELSISQVIFLNETFDKLAGQLSWLGYDDILVTLSIVSRSPSQDHAVLANKLYESLVSWPATKREDLQQHLEPILPEVLASLARAGNDQAALILCSDAGRVQPMPLKLWTALLSVYHDINDLVGFTKIQDYMTVQNIKVDTNIINLQLELLNENKFFEDARSLYTTMASRYRVDPDWKTRLIMLDLCMNEQTADLAHKNALETLGESIYLQLSSEDANGRAEEVFPRLICWLVFTGQPLENIHGKIKEMQNNGCDLNIHIVNSMLHAASVSNQWSLVERLWTSIVSPDILPTDKTFSFRIAASVMAGDIRGAKALFEASKSSGYADMLDPATLQTFLASEMMGQQPDVELCHQIIQLLEKIEPFPITPTSLMFLVPKMLEMKQYARLEGLLELSRTRADWNTKRTIYLILDQMATTEDPKRIWNISIMLKNLFWTDPLYDLEARSVLLRKLIHLDQPQMLGALFSQFSNSTIKPDNQMYILLLKGAAECRSVGLIRKLHESLKMDVTVSEHTAVLNTLMNAYAYVNSPIAFDVWDQLFRGGRGPSHASVSIIIDACSYARAPVRGAHIWTALARRGFNFNDNNYASFVEMCNRYNNTEEAFRVLEDAIQRHGQNGRDTSGSERNGDGAGTGVTKTTGRVGERAVSTLYNTAATGKREDVRRWAEEWCPDVWTALQIQS